MALRRGGAAAKEQSLPTCNPCTDGDHGRCPQVLAANDIIDSNFKCLCFQRDPEEHEGDFAINQERHHGEWFNDYDIPGPRRIGGPFQEYERWAGDG